MPSHTSPTGHIRDPQHCTRVCEWVLDLGYQTAASSKFSRFSLLKISVHQMCPHNLCPVLISHPKERNLPAPALLAKHKAPGTEMSHSEDMINYLNRQNYIPLVTFSSTCALPLPFPPHQPPSSSSPCGHVPARDLLLSLHSLLNVFYSQPPAPGPLINY